MILTIDVGNTRVKAAVFEQNNLLQKDVFEIVSLVISIEKLISKFPKIKKIVVGSVKNVQKSAFVVFENNFEIHFISRKDPFPFKNLYKTPQTLGIDRLVLASGAVLQYPNQNRLVIDAGTCVTFDFIDQDNRYFGGAISPGLRLRYAALHQYTDKLPLLETENPENLLGNSTNQSIHAGVVNGLIFEIDGFIDQLKQEYSNFIIILTGGDAEFLAKRLKNAIFANSNFLLESLNHTFQYKIKND